MPHALSSSRPLLLALIIALGIAIAWCVVVAWILGLVQVAAQVHHVREDIYVSSDGQPLIVRVEPGTSGATQKVFSLDRQPLEVDPQRMGHPEYLIGPYYAGGPQGIAWSSRLAGANDGGSPATYWYLVHDGRVNGLAHGVGYHSQSGAIVGYFGKQGFSQGPPPRDDWFQVFGDRGLQHVATSTTTMEPIWDEGGHSLVLLADGKVWIIDVAKRELSALADCPNALTAGWLRPPVRSQVAGEPPDLRKLLVWEKERLLIIDRETQEQTSLPLPPELRTTALAAIELPDSRLLLIAHNLNRWEEDYVLTWFDPQGQMTEQRRVELARYGAAPEPASFIWGGVLAAPFPLATALTALVYPAEQVALGRAESFGATLADVLRRTWPAFLVVLAISILLAADAYRRQRQYASPHALAWAVFVFVLGIPGWLAFRIHRAWPALEPCHACRQPAPIDHSACPDCGAVVPAPQLIGTEVFA